MAKIHTILSLINCCLRYPGRHITTTTIRPAGLIMKRLLVLPQSNTTRLSVAAVPRRMKIPYEKYPSSHAVEAKPTFCLSFKASFTIDGLEKCCNRFDVFPKSASNLN
jgi:hypothetical protein